MQDIQKDLIAKTLFSTKAVFISVEKPFTWTSGIKSPIYCDNRVLISFVKERNIIAKNLANLINQNFLDMELIGATATGAIAHGAFVSEILQKPMVYILSKSKTHGRCKMIEGSFNKNQKTVILEDLISTGKSSISAIKASRDEGLEVLGCVSIFNYGFNESISNFKSIDCKVYSLITLDDLLAYAEKNNLITHYQKELIRDWREDPYNFKF